MAVQLGSYIFNCGERHRPALASPAPKAESRYEVAGLDGVGILTLGRRTRFIQVSAWLAEFVSETQLAAALAADETQRSLAPATLIVGGVSYTDCQLKGIDHGPRQIDGKNGLWFAPRVTYLFEQLDA